ncbi:MAG: hypothetical protein PHV37_08945 [Candidatus Gastranaerophilales bacterium]|nr:hypothetical protein [Candidatus Gastranaerophilales bacterium]
MNIKNIFLSLICLMQFSSMADASIKVSPLFVELKSNNSRNDFVTASINVEADKNETVRYKIYPEFFRISEKGDMNIIDLKDSPDSLIRNAKYVPNEFTLKDGKPQKVRITVTNLKQLPVGESRMVVFFEDVATKELLLSNPNPNMTTKLIVKTRIGVPIYFDKGNIARAANFDDLSIKNNGDKNLTYNVKLSSKGNSRIRCSGKAQIIKDGQLVSEYNLNPMVLAQSSNYFNSGEIPLKDITSAGKYNLRLTISYQDGKNKLRKMYKEQIFEVSSVKTSQINQDNITTEKNTTAQKIENYQ